MDISSTRLATVDFGDFSLKEEFIVASITSSLLSLGKLMKHGWNLQKFGDELHLVKGDKAIPVSFKRDSLCISGSIRMVESSSDLHLRVVHLQPLCSVSRLHGRGLQQSALQSKRIDQFVLM